MSAITALLPAAATTTKSAVPVEWRHDGRHYHFTPRGDASGGCRNATLVIDGRRPHDVLACPSGRGEWTFRRS